MNDVKQKSVRIRGIALPNEHGSWGFLFEPIVVAFALAPTLASLSVSVLFVGAFLTRQPFKIRMSNLIARRNLPHNQVAMRLILIYGSIAATGLAMCLILIKIEYLLPFALVVPLAIFQIYSDAAKKSRDLLPEITGSIAISSSAAVMALAAGWSTYAAFALWGILIARFIPSILYVRNRLLLEKGKPSEFASVVAVHSLALVFVTGLSLAGLSSWLVAGIFALLLLRASLGLSRFRRKKKAMMIGVGEVLYGLLTVLAIIVGHYLM